MLEPSLYRPRHAVLNVSLNLTF